MIGNTSSNIEETEALAPAPARARSRSPFRRGARERDIARTIDSGRALVERMGFIVRRMQREPWLPIAIRSMIAEEYVQIRRLHERSELSMEDARERVRRLAVACFRYDDLTLRSNTLCQIRALDLEFTGRLP